MSSRLTKKSFVNVFGRLVKTPCVDLPTFAPRTRRPPTETVISGAVKVSNCTASRKLPRSGPWDLGFHPEVGQLRYAVRPSGEDDLAIKRCCHLRISDGSARGLRLLLRDMRPLSQPAAEGNVLARRLVERDQ